MKYKILAIDDEENILKLLKVNLEKHNYEVYTSTKPTKIIKLAKEFKPDVIILDEVMPEMSGLSVAGILSHDRKLKNIPVIFLSATIDNNTEDNYTYLPKTVEVFKNINIIIKDRLYKNRSDYYKYKLKQFIHCEQNRFALMALIIFCILFYNIAEEHQSVSWFKKTFKELTWPEVQQIVSSPREICARVRHRVIYKPDTEDIWDDGKTTWTREYGDCEDISQTIVDLCKEKNIPAWVEVFSIDGGTEGHAVVLGYWGNKMWMASNGWFQYIDDLADAKHKVSREFKHWRGKNINSSRISGAALNGFRWYETFN